MKFILRSSDAPENCGFTRWVDPAPIDSVQEFIEYLQIKIFYLECKVNHYEKVSEGNKDDEDDDTSNAAALQDEPCTIPYCNCRFTVCYVGVRLLGLPSASHMLHRCVCCVFLNYLRHVSLVQNLFTVVATGSVMPLHV